MTPLTITGILFTIAAIIIAINAVIDWHRDPDHDTGGLIGLTVYFTAMAGCAFFPGQIGKVVQSIVSHVQ